MLGGKLVRRSSPYPNLPASAVEPPRACRNAATVTDPSLLDYVLLSVAALLGGAINALAGGGTLLTFPALLFVLGAGPAQPELAKLANITSKVALFPASISSALGFRRELLRAWRWLLLLAGPSLVGGVLGSWLLTYLPAETFAMAVPWLILTAVVLFAVQPAMARWTVVGRPNETPSSGTLLAVMTLQFLIGLYGGYFGAGIGILMLTGMAFSGMHDIHEMNALKAVLGSLINGISIIYFLFVEPIHWPIAIVMAFWSTVGGYVAASGSRRFDKNKVRIFVTALGFVLAAYYFWKTFLAG